MDLLAKIDALIAQRTQEDRGPPLSDEERAKELVRIVGMWASSKEVRARVDKLAEEPEFAELAEAIRAAGQRKQEEFKEWLAEFKAAQVARDAARAPLATPTPDDMADFEVAPVNQREAARRGSKLSRWWEAIVPRVMGEQPPEPEPDPREEAARRKRMNQRAEEWGERIRWQRDKPTWGSWMG